jgi:hypothetical protein
MLLCGLARRDFAWGLNGGAPSVSRLRAGPIQGFPVHPETGTNEGPLTARWGGRGELSETLLLSAFATVATGRRGVPSLTLQRPQARPTSILTQGRQRYKRGGQTPLYHVLYPRTGRRATLRNPGPGRVAPGNRGSHSSTTRRRCHPSSPWCGGSWSAQLARRRRVL